MKCATINCGNEAALVNRRGLLSCERCYEETDLAIPWKGPLLPRIRTAVRHWWHRRVLARSSRET
jgi:hypothetical protein